jgi:NAD+ synthase/NAD+ synthase (glutamine-hydrolysing)
VSQLIFTIAQINPTMGDIHANLHLMIDAAAQAHRAGSALVAFPELSLCGYYPGDLLDEADFPQRIEQGVQALRSASRTTPGLYWVVGVPMPQQAGPGKRWRNALLVVRNGEVLLQYTKQLLPTYDVFDESRHFAPGANKAQVLSIKDSHGHGETRVGFLICEDGWNDDGSGYAVNPFDELRKTAPDMVLSINASPSHLGKREQRHRLFTTASKKHRLPMVYINQVGGHDALVYDGASFAVEPDAGVVFEAQRFAVDHPTLRFAKKRFWAADGQALAPFATDEWPAPAVHRAQIVLGLRDYARRCGFTRAVVGSSGGIDSALTLVLATEALGAENITAITLPSQFSSQGSVDDSVQLCNNLGIELLTHPIQHLVEVYAQQFDSSFTQPLQGLALENLQARIRGTVLMAYSNRFGHLLLTTGNKSEIAVGYCTLYGDTNGGLGPIGDLYKTEVFALSRYLNEKAKSAGHALIPQAIIDKAPSAELAPDQKDEDSLPPYPVLDAILKTLIEGEHLLPQLRAEAHATVQSLRHTPEGRALIQRVQQMMARSEYKRRQAPPLLRVSPRAFGAGRQMPLATKG